MGQHIRVVGGLRHYDPWPDVFAEHWQPMPGSLDREEALRRGALVAALLLSPIPALGGAWLSFVEATDDLAISVQQRAKIWAQIQRWADVGDPERGLSLLAIALGSRTKASEARVWWHVLAVLLVVLAASVVNILHIIGVL